MIKTYASVLITFYEGIFRTFKDFASMKLRFLARLHAALFYMRKKYFYSKEILLWTTAFWIQYMKTMKILS